MHESTVIRINAELLRARAKFPGNRHLLTALVEEVGELAKSYLQKEPKDRQSAEATQVACLAVRIIEEGDAVFETLTDEEAKP